MSANTFKFDGFTLVQSEDKNRLDVLFTEAEDAKVAYLNANDVTLIRGILSALNHTVKGSYAVVEPDAILRMTLEEVEDELVADNVGYMLGSRLLELQAAGKVRRVKEIITNEWYRLNWSVDHFTTEDVVWKAYDAEEADYVRHNRNFLAMADGFNAIRKAQAKNMNLSLSWTGKFDPFINELLVDFGLRAEGKTEEADKRYTEKVVTSQTRNTFRRVGAQVQNNPEVAKSLNDLGDAFVTLFNGEVVSVVDLFGKNAQMVVGNMTVPFIYTFTPELSAQIAETARRQHGKFVIIEQ